MDNLNDIKAVWLSAKTDILPAADEMLKMVKKFRRNKLSKKWMMIVLAFVLVALMTFVMFIYKSAMMSTRIGELLMIAACCVLITTNVRSLKRFYDLDDCSNKEFIAFLEQTRINQVNYYKKTQVVGLVLSSAGLLLYVYEMVYKHILLLVIVYALTVIYILILGLVVRPRVFRREAKKLKETMDRLDILSKQINN